MSSRVNKEQQRKSALALAAVRLIEPQELLFLDSGSTNLGIVNALPEDFGLTVATNSIDIAAAVLRRPDLHLITIGGVVDPDIGGSVDMTAVQSATRLNINRCFVGACAISKEFGVSAFGNNDALFKSAVLGASEYTILLATNDKFSVRASYRVATAAEIDHWVVEHDVEEDILTALSKTGTRVLQAEPPQINFFRESISL